MTQWDALEVLVRDRICYVVLASSIQALGIVKGGRDAVIVGSPATNLIRILRGCVPPILDFIPPGPDIPLAWPQTKGIHPVCRPILDVCVEINAASETSVDLRA